MPRAWSTLAMPFATLSALAAAIAVPASFPAANEYARAQTIAAGLLPAAALPIADAATSRATLRLAPPELPFEPAFEPLPDDGSGPLPAPAPAEIAAVDEAELTCMAKAVHREARSQSREGQLAVAQLIMARIASGRFADSVCGVVNQRGQFFSTAAYQPNRAHATWTTAVEVAREAMADGRQTIAPGALFFHAAYLAPNSFFRTRQRVATLGEHVFYR